MDSPRTLIEAITYFSDEQVCIDAVAEMRWTNGPKCPECWAEKPYYIKTQKRWKCRNCRIQFSVKRGSIFEDSALPLSKWLPVLWLLVNCKNGISSYEVSKAIGTTQKTAWFMLQRLRLVLKEKNIGTKFGSNDGGEVEVDESFVGGKLKNMHRSRANKLNKVKYGTGYETRVKHENKTAVMGILDRESRQVRAMVIPDVKRETLQTEILNNVKFGSAVYTDAALHYIQAYFSGLNPPVVFSSHFLRDSAIEENKKIKQVYRDYRSLKDWTHENRQRKCLAIGRFDDPSDS